MGERSHGGWIGDHDAELVRVSRDRMVLRVGGHEYDVVASRIDHRVEDGVVRFAAKNGAGGEFRAAYPHRGPTEEEIRWDDVDFTADEPWTWEDGDFGEFVFHVVTATGPIKYRHALAWPDGELAPTEWVSTIDGDVLVRAGTTCGLPFEHRIPLDAIDEIAAKFELSGIWAPSSIVVVRSACRVIAVPVDRTFADDPLLVAFRALPGWDAAADAAIADAIEYAERRVVGPQTPEETPTRRERPVWTRGAPG
ncbi:MAG: hypothetical protein PGN13_15825 [Patulibacter minatonensis]